jgi:hypothetical protein
MDDTAFTIDELLDLRSLAKARAENGALHPKTRAYYETLADKCSRMVKKLCTPSTENR